MFVGLGAPGEGDAPALGSGDRSSCSHPGTGRALIVIQDTDYFDSGHERDHCVLSPFGGKVELDVFVLSRAAGCLEARSERRQLIACKEEKTNKREKVLCIMDVQTAIFGSLGTKRRSPACAACGAHSHRNSRLQGRLALRIFPLSKHSTSPAHQPARHERHSDETRRSLTLARGQRGNPPGAERSSLTRDQSRGWLPSRPPHRTRPCTTICALRRITSPFRSTWGVQYDCHPYPCRAMTFSSRR